jgi:hypothetical protein
MLARNEEVYEIQEGIGLGAAETPAQFRAIYEKWAADPTTPEDDSDLFEKNREPSETPRLAHLAETHKSLLYWDRLNRINDPLATSWMEPAQPDEPGDDDKPYRAPKVSNDCTHEMRPTENELLAIFLVEELESGPIPTAGGGGVFRGVVGDIVFGPERRARKPLTGTVRPIQRLGALVFGTEYTKDGSGCRGSVIRFGASATKRGFEPFARHGQPKGEKRSKKVQKHIDKSNAHYAKMLRTSPFKFIRGKRRVKSVDWDLIQSRREHTHIKKTKLLKRLGVSGSVPFAEARARVGLPPGMAVAEPALPCGTEMAASQFIGMRALSRQQIFTPVEDPYDRLHELYFLRGQLGLDHCRVLDVALYCRSYGHLGAELGTYDHKAKKLLEAATKKLSKSKESLRRIATGKVL